MRTVLALLIWASVLVVLAAPGLAGDSVATPSVQLRVVASDPAGSEMLARRDMLYLRIAYDSAVPLRIQARGYFGGVEAGGLRASNVAPVYPAGRQEALAWLAYADGAAIDEIRLTAYDTTWTPLVTVSVPMSVSWGPRGKRHFASAAWVRTLGQRQLAMVNEQIDMARTDTTGAEQVAVSIGFLAVPGYVLAQLWLLYAFRGGWRIAAGGPLIVMVPLTLYSLAAFAMGANLWPLLLLFAAPAALLYLGAVVVCRLLLGAAPPSRTA